jgi:TolA-binding protein
MLFGQKNRVKQKMRYGLLPLAVGVVLMAGCTASGDPMSDADRAASHEQSHPLIEKDLESLRSDISRVATRLNENDRKIAALQDGSGLSPSGKQGPDERQNLEVLRKRADSLTASVDEMRRKVDKICFYQQAGAGDFLAPCKK